MNKKLLSLIPKQLKNKSGSVFYSSLDAFQGNKALYILGLNPGGSPIKQGHQTLKHHTKKNLNKRNWSEYRDESWNGTIPGTSGMQPKILHLFKVLNLNPSDIPASNVVFVRTQTESKLEGRFNYYANLCWPFHEYVIKTQKIKLILCFGKTCGTFVRNKLNALHFLDEYIETNRRKWKTQIFENEKGIKVIVATHPSRANWKNPNSDPSYLIKKYI